MRQRHAFTLIEMLVVIGILMLLVGMTFLGLNAYRGTMESKATRVSLENCRAMLNEYLQKGQVATLDAIYISAGVSPLDATKATSYIELPLPPHDAYLDFTHQVMGQLLALPANRAITSKLPAEQLKNDPGYSPPPPPPPPLHDAHGPLILDAGGVPIIYVPSGGLSNVTVGGTVKTITSPDGRPFFAAAGNDGKFDAGDDNIYSFEN